MKLLVVLLAVIASVLAAKEAVRYNGLAAVLAKHGGMVPKRQSRIINGNPITIEEIPYIVSIQLFSSHRCGGVIISNTQILTAAQCTILIEANTLSIRAGSTYSQIGGQLIGVTFVNNHPQYNPATLNNDIAVMHLASSLDFSPRSVAAIAMPVQGAGTPNRIICGISGWGAVCEGCAASPYLRATRVYIVTNSECNSMYGGGITDGMICTGHFEGGACGDDIGGPLTVSNQVVGIISWSEGCGRSDFPGVYARVSHYRNWIDVN